MQLAFRNRYNDRAIRFVCGDQAAECSNAFRNWAGALAKNFDQLARDGPSNEFNGNLKVSHNSDGIKNEFDTTLLQIQTYTKAL